MLRDTLANLWKVNAEEGEQTRGHPQVVGAEPEAANAPGSVRVVGAGVARDLARSFYYPS